MRKLGTCLLAVCAGIAATAQPAHAQQTLNFSLGYFTVRGEDARVERDILVRNLSDFAFDVDDFNGATVGGEWLVALGEYFEAGAGVGFSRRTVPSVYADFVDTDGSEIEQDFRLRLVPVSFTVRVLPLGQSSGFQPYVGGGLGIFSWRYSETGEFLDFGGRQPVIFREQYVASGSATGPIALGGIRFAGSSVSAGAEIRYQGADTALEEDFAPLAPASNPFRLDLGGWTYQFTVGYRFGR
jgi:hypothetical protein